MDNKIEVYENSTDLIEENYPGNYPEQMPIYLWIDWETEEITAGTRNYQIGGTPMREWHGLVSAYRLPWNVDARELQEWVQNEIIPVVIEIEAGFESYWDGSNWKGRFSENVDSDLSYIIETTCPTHEGGLWDVSSWFESYPDITADSTDEEIQEIANDEVRDAENNGIILIGGVEKVFEYLTMRRDELKEDVEE